MSFTQILRIAAPAVVLASFLAACANDYGQRSRPVTLRENAPTTMSSNTEPAAQDQAPQGQTMSPQ